MTQEGGRVFPQVKAKNVDILPVLNESEVTRLDTVMREVSYKPASEAWQEKVDMEISLRFGLTLAEHNYIREELGRK